MLAGTVPGVDDRNRADGGRSLGRALLVVAYDDDVRITADDPDRVFECFAFGRRRELARVVGAHRLTAEAQHRRLEGQARAGRGLVEERGHHLAVEAAGEAVRLTLDLVGPREEVFEKRARELLALDHVPESASDGHQKTSFPVSLYRT